jgi:hypothetical protein
VLSVAVASLSSRRIIAGATIIGLFLVTSIVSVIIVGEEPVFEDGSAAGAINLAALPLHLRDVIFLGHTDPEGPMGGVPGGGLLAAGVFTAVVAVCLGTLLWRYNEVDR